MQLFDHAEVDRLNALAKRAIAGIELAIKSTGATACVTGGGSIFRVHFKQSPPHNYREAFSTPEEAHQLKIMLDHLFEEGLLMINTCSAVLSTPMGEAEIDTLVEKIESGFRKLT